MADDEVPQPPLMCKWSADLSKAMAHNAKFAPPNARHSAPLIGSKEDFATSSQRGMSTSTPTRTVDASRARKNTSEDAAHTASSVLAQVIAVGGDSNAATIHSRHSRAVEEIFKPRSGVDLENHTMPRVVRVHSDSENASLSSHDLHSPGYIMEPTKIPMLGSDPEKTSKALPAASVSAPEQEQPGFGKETSTSQDQAENVVPNHVDTTAPANSEPKLSAKDEHVATGSSQLAGPTEVTTGMRSTEFANERSEAVQLANGTPKPDPDTASETKYDPTLESGAAAVHTAYVGQATSPILDSSEEATRTNTQNQTTIALVKDTQPREKNEQLEYAVNTPRMEPPQADASDGMSTASCELDGMCELLEAADTPWITSGAAGCTACLMASARIARLEELNEMSKASPGANNQDKPSETTNEIAIVGDNSLSKLVADARLKAENQRLLDVVFTLKSELDRQPVKQEVLEELICVKAQLVTLREENDSLGRELADRSVKTKTKRRSGSK